MDQFYPISIDCFRNIKGIKVKRMSRGVFFCDSFASRGTQPSGSQVTDRDLMNTPVIKLWHVEHKREQNVCCVRGHHQVLIEMLESSVGIRTCRSAFSIVLFSLFYSRHSSDFLKSFSKKDDTISDGI